MSTETKNTGHDWLFDITRTDPRVLAHLTAENRTTDEALAPLKPLEAELVAEMRTRESVDFRSAEVQDGNWVYFEEISAEASQLRHLRRNLTTNITELLLDEEAEANGDYYALGTLEVSDDHTRMVYTEDRVGDEDYTLIVKDLATGTELSRLEDVTDEAAFSFDGEHVLFVRTDKSDRPCEVWSLHIASGEETLIYREPNEQYLVSIDVTRDDNWFTISSCATETRTVLLLDRRTLAGLTPFTNTVEGVKITVESFDNNFWVYSNHESLDGGIYLASIGQDIKDWQTILAPNSDAYVEGFALFNDFIAIEARINGFARVATATRNGATIGTLNWIGNINDASTTAIDENPMPELNTLRLERSDWTTPDATWLYTITNGVAIEGGVEVQDIVGGYNQDDYQAEVIWVTSYDGVRVPVSLLTSKDTPIVGTFLYAYGAYGMSEDPCFVSSWISLMDRGIACAVVHARGGSEFGRKWHDAGRLENKTNTFKDVAAAARELTALGYAPNGNIVLRGGSAGGLMVGATINLAPELFRGAIAEVPFVDCLTTMNNPELPLTIGEYTEWGNPNDPEAYARIASYSPIDNVAPKNYPTVLATAGLHDPRVGYWEPAKWVLALRENTTSGNSIYLRTKMNGHGYSPDRWESIKEKAELLAFALDCLGVKAKQEATIAQ